MSFIIGTIQVITFFFAIILAFFIPGRVALGKKTSIEGLSLWISSVVVGMVLWGVQGWVFGYLSLRWLSYIYLFIFLGIFLWKKCYGFLEDVAKVKKMPVDYLALSISLIGVIAQNINYFRMGWMTKDGFLLNTFNVSDHIWHAALTQEIVQRFPPDEPGMYGVLVKNYHFWFNLVTAEIIRVFHLPLIPTQFMGMYVLGSILLGLTAYLVVKAIYPSRLFLWIVLFFVYMGGDAMGWLTLITRHSFIFLGQRIEDATIFMDNPPRAFSVIVILTGIYLLFLSLKKPTIRMTILIAFLFGTAIGFKVYTGIAFLIALAVLIGFKMLKRQFSYIPLGILAAGIAAAIFIPVNSGSGGLFFVPFELPRDFVAQPIVGLHDWELRWRIYYAHNNIKRLIQYGIYMTIVYVFGQYGIRVLGLFPWKKMREVLGGEKGIFLYSATLAGLILGTFFYQHAGTANIFNFYIAAGLPLIFLTGLSLTLFLEKKAMWVKVIVLLLVFAFVIPRFVFANYVNITTEFFNTPPSISYAELASYTFLSHVPTDSLVLVVIPQHHYVLDIDTPLVSLMTNRHMFLSGNGIISSHGAENEDRLSAVTTITKSTDPKEVTRILHKYHISYLYFYDEYSLGVPLNTIPAKVVFTNSASTILQVM